ncbi:hypothetical protein AHF37_12544 [Paragonimus kellicotti]|nr:hypothetical protein AHF37_12544 [Paragonimus kellicotti]
MTPETKYKYAVVISERFYLIWYTSTMRCIILLLISTLFVMCLSDASSSKPKNAELATMTMNEFVLVLAARIHSIIPALKDKLAKTDLGQQFLDTRLKNREFLMTVIDKIEAYTKQA